MQELFLYGLSLIPALFDFASVDAITDAVLEPHLF